jgi:hypothetical protein
MTFTEFIILRPFDLEGGEALLPGDCILLDESSVVSRELVNTGYIKPNLGEYIRETKQLFGDVSYEEGEDPDSVGWCT